MEMSGWFDGEWFELLQSVSIVFSLLATVHTIRREGKERRIQNVIALTTAHREIWSRIVENPRLGRVLSRSACRIRCGRVECLRTIADPLWRELPAEFEDELLEGESNRSVETVWDKEIEHRVEEVKNGTVQLISADEADRRADALFGDLGLMRQRP